MKRRQPHWLQGMTPQCRQWLGISVLLFILVGLASITYPVEEMSRRLDDLYFRLRGAQPTSNAVVMVVIDDASLARVGRWPWPRHIVADILRAASAQHPRVLALDILLAEPEDEWNDAQLADAIRGAGNVVLASKISSSSENHFWVEPLPRFSRAGAGIGHVQTVLDADGICRRIPISEPTLDGPRRAFALEAAFVAKGRTSTASTASSLWITPHSPGSDTPGLERMSLNLMSIDFRGQIMAGHSSTPFVTISAQDLLAGKAEGQLRGKAVLIGFGATELSDRFSTPISDHFPMPGVEINANLLDQALAGRELRSLPEIVQVLLLLGLCVLSTWTVLHWDGRAGLILAGIILLAAYGGGFLLFSYFHRQIDFGPFLCACLLAAPLAQLAKLMFVERSITAGLRNLEKVFGEAQQGTLRGAFTSVIPRSRGLRWKVDLLHRLQSELVALYGFDNSLLEAMREGLAVFAGDGRALYQNASWRAFCERQNWRSSLSLEEFIGLLGESRWSELGKKVVQPGQSLEREIFLGDGLWHLRAVRLSGAPKINEATFMLTVGDMTDRLERDRARAEAIGFVTHELRTPLTAIQGFAELMMRERKAPPDSNAPATIFRECRRLVAMVNTYLDVLGLDAGNRSLQMEAISPEKLTIQVSQIIQPLAEAAGITLKLSFEAETPNFQGDTRLISGALLSLLSDVVKASRRGSEVKLAVFGYESEIVFELENINLGIQSATKPSVVSDGSLEEGRHTNPLSRRGLGLSFVRRIVEKHGGTLRSETGSDGHCLRISFPSNDAKLCEVVI